MIKSKVENIPVGEVSFLTEIPDINKFISSDDDALDFPRPPLARSVTQQALEAQTRAAPLRAQAEKYNKKLFTNYKK